MVHPIIAELCDIAKRDPLPPDHTSSHWAVYGEQTRAEIDKDGLHLHGVGFGDYQRRLLQWLPGIVGRWSHRKASSECRSFADTHTTAIRLARDLSLGYTYDVWRQTVALSVLRDHWEEYDLQPQSFLMIGDGHGFLGALVRRVIPDAHIYSVDLPKMMVFQAVTYAHSDPVACLNVGASAESDVDFLKPEDIESLPSEIDCAVNVASMAEMKAESIHSYFIASELVLRVTLGSIASTGQPRLIRTVRKSASPHTLGNLLMKCLLMAIVHTTLTSGL